MTSTTSGPSRRDFLRASAGGGFALGSLLGLDLRAAQAEVRRLKIAGAREVPSVCPYCAVGCGQIVSVRQGQDGVDRIVNIEGNPESPINQGTLCAKGAATFQLAVNERRITRVLYRAPGAADWEPKPLDWAMDRIARRVKETRDQTFRERWKDPTGKEKLVNHTLGIAWLGGATMDNEWNYLQCKLMRALGVVQLENQARI
jgi:formate dehydrogenase major subunit